MKNKVRNIIGIIFILIGLTLLIYAFKGKWETARMQDQLCDKFIAMNEEDMELKEENKETKAEEYNYVDKVTPIAYMKVPKINLKVVVAEGTEQEIIKYAVGHFEETVLPGQVGNCAIAGHRNYDTGEFFLKLNKLEEGDDIIISTHEKSFTYKVTKTFVVGPEDTYILDPSEEAIVTLVTCTYDGKERLIVQGKLQDTEELNN